MKRRQSAAPRAPRLSPEPAARWARWLAAAAALLLVGAAVYSAYRLAEPNGTPRRLEWDATAPPLLLAPPPDASNAESLFEEGRQLAEELGQRFSNDPAIVASAGRLAFSIGNASKAIELWERSLRLDPACPAALLGMAERAREQGEFARAIELMQQLDKADHALAVDKLFILADSLMGLGKPAEAARVIENAAEGRPVPLWAQLMLAQAFYRQEDLARAAREYEKAIALQPDSSEAHYGLSQTLRRLGKPDEAARHRNEYARLKKGDMQSFDRMHGYGTQKERQGPDKLRPILAQAHLNTAVLYRAHGDWEATRRHALRSWALAPAAVEPRQLLESLGE